MLNPQKLFSLERDHGLSMELWVWAAEAPWQVPSFSAAGTVKFPIQGETINMLGFMSHTNSVTTIHLCCCSMKTSINYNRNKRSYIPSCFMGMEIWISCYFHVLWNNVLILLFSNYLIILKLLLAHRPYKNRQWQDLAHSRIDLLNKLFWLHIPSEAQFYGLPSESIGCDVGCLQNLKIPWWQMLERHIAHFREGYSAVIKNHKFLATLPRWQVPKHLQSLFTTLWHTWVLLGHQ